MLNTINTPLANATLITSQPLLASNQQPAFLIIRLSVNTISAGCLQGGDKGVGAAAHRNRMSARVISGARYLAATHSLYSLRP
jgi:hypothetical protein